jgi:hypothetical protein
MVSLRLIYVGGFTCCKKQADKGTGTEINVARTKKELPCLEIKILKENHCRNR